MKKLQLEIVGLSFSQTQSGAYALVLGEKNGKRRLPIIIGGFEAQSIAIELEKIQPSRPLTHDLFKSFAEGFNINIKEVIIYNLVEGIFYAKLICENDDRELEIDARTSDAIALAVRFKCPIYTYEFILSTAGIILEDGAIVEQKGDDDDLSGVAEESKAKKEDFKALTESELRELLKSAVEEENYEKASKIRDELNKRKQS